MIRGIGVDATDICEMRQLLQDVCSFKRHTFTAAEIAVGERRTDSAEYYATRFAAKEAVYKAVGHLIPGECFDLRVVETLNAVDGSPYIHITEELALFLQRAGVDKLHISLTTEGNYATAFVISEKL